MKIQLTLIKRNGAILTGRFGWHEAVARVMVHAAERDMFGFLFVPVAN